ncbi:hypothetical protein ACQP3J_29380, partial [Escherichia coli]
LQFCILQTAATVHTYNPIPLMTDRQNGDKRNHAKSIYVGWPPRHPVSNMLTVKEKQRKVFSDIYTQTMTNIHNFHTKRITNIKTENK